MKTARQNLNRLPRVVTLAAACHRKHVPKRVCFRDSKIENSTPSHCFQSHSAQNQPNRPKSLVLVIVGAVLSSLGVKKRKNLVVAQFEPASSWSSAFTRLPDRLKTELQPSWAATQKSFPIQSDLRPWQVAAQLLPSTG
jgi:hypothetical protein